MKYTILIIDDNKQFTNHLQQILLQEISNLIKNIYVYNNSEKVINDIEQLKPDILLLDEPTNDLDLKSRFKNA